MTAQAGLFAPQPRPRLPIEIYRYPAGVVPVAGAGPLIKWVGGKTDSAPKIAGKLPGVINGYFEPMVGGGALFWYLASHGRLTGFVVLADSNPHLIAMMAGVRTDVEAVIRGLRLRIDRYRSNAEEVYYVSRDELRRGDTSDVIAMAELFLFLNRTCFNGLWRVNSKGEFNASWCRNPKVNILFEPQLRAAARMLTDVQLVCADYRQVTAHAQAGDVCYLDPPYCPVSATADFTSYTVDGFSDADQVQLRDEVLRLRAAGVVVAASNADVPRARELYADIPVQQLMADRRVNSDAQKRGAVPELLIGGLG